MTKIVSVVSGKGGAAKTSTALGLASTWANDGQSVLVVDTDPQDAGSASWWLERNSGNTVGFLAASGAELAANRQQLTDDLVVVDTAPRLDDVDLTAVVGISDLVIVVTQPAPLDVAAASQTITSAVKPAGKPYIVVLTMVHSRSLNEAHEARGDLLALGHPVAGSLIRYFAPVRRAAFKGDLPADLNGPSGHKHRSDLQGLAAELAMNEGMK